MTALRMIAWCSVAALAMPALGGQPPATHPAAELAKPDHNDRQIVQGVSMLIEQAHLKQHKVDADISRRMHRLFIEGWDPKKLFFLESDVAEFAAAETKHADFLTSGDL